MSQEDNPERLAPPVDKVPPEAVALRAQPRPVKRLSRRTLAALVGGLAVAVLGATIWSLRPPERRERHGPAELYNVDRVSRSEGLESLPADYSQLPPTKVAQPPELGPPLPGDLGPAILKSQRPAAPIYTPAGQDPAEAERLARLKEAEEAAGSSLFFQTDSRRFASTANASSERTAQASMLAALDPPATVSSSEVAQSTDPMAVQNRQQQKEQFLRPDTMATRNTGDLQLPASPYQVMAGTVIAGALVTGIKSDLPGDIIGTLTEPV